MPLCERRQRARAITLALLFGLGLTVTFAVWGVAIAGIGGFLGLREVARYLSILGGAVAYVLGLGTLGLLGIHLPCGSVQLPAVLQGKSEYAGALALGMLFGNMGLCCPDPVFLSMIPFIAAGQVTDGGMMAAAYGLGRATPLVALVVLASTGVDSFQIAVRHRRALDRVVGWSLVAVGTFMLYGYAGVSHDHLFAVLLMGAPVVAWHIKRHSPARRVALWLSTAAVGTVVGIRIVHVILVNLP